MFQQSLASQNKSNRNTYFNALCARAFKDIPETKFQTSSHETVERFSFEAPPESPFQYLCYIIAKDTGFFFFFFFLHNSQGHWRLNSTIKTQLLLLSLGFLSVLQSSMIKKAKQIKERFVNIVIFLKNTHC